MSNSTITNVNQGSVLLEAGPVDFQSDELTIAATTTVLEGTILARDSATGLMVVFVAGGSTDDNGIPKSVITYAVENTTAAPVNVAVRIPISAKVRKNRLVIASDGDDSNVDKAVLDQLRDYGIFATEVDDLSTLDNQ